MSGRAELAPALAALAVTVAGVWAFVRLLGVGALDEGLLLAAAAGFAAVTAQLGAGLALRPVLALSLPLLAGWWIATLAALDLATTLLLAAGGGAVAGAVVGLAAAGPFWRAATVTLALALVGGRLSDAFAADRLAASPAVAGVEAVVLAALAALGLGWWAQHGLTGALVRHAGDAAAAARLGLALGPRLALLGGWGGLAGGAGGAVLAQAGAAPPSIATGLVLAVAALAGAGSIAVTAALTAVFWLLPQLALRARPDVPDLAPWLAGAAAVALLVGGLGAGGPEARGRTARDG